MRIFNFKHLLQYCLGLYNFLQKEHMFVEKFVLIKLGMKYIFKYVMSFLKKYC